MKKIRLTESELISLIEKLVTESPLGDTMLEKLYDRIKDKYPNVKYDKGDREFEPYIYISIGKTKKTGLLIEIDDDDNFEIHYDDGRVDKPWVGWKKEIERLNSPKNAERAIEMFMDKRK